MTVTLTPDLGMVLVLILIAIALFSSYFLISLCLKIFRRSNKVLIKIFTIFVAFLIGIKTSVVVSVSLFWFFLLPFPFCNAWGHQTIHLPRYFKTVYIVNDCSFMSSFKTIYVRESWLPVMKKIGSTPMYMKESTSIDRSEIVPQDNFLEFEYLEVRGALAEVAYNLKTGELIVEEIEVK
ncbi:MAG: hypothetical protein SVX43_10645 [Cyanobacteriota bacterium]|nr:hypothetical protein [Cyanobacteriota bacterium]